MRGATLANRRALGAGAAQLVSEASGAAGGAIQEGIGASDLARGGERHEVAIGVG